MATTKFKGQPVKIIGEFIKVGAVAPDFELVKTDLSSCLWHGPVHVIHMISLH